MDPRQSKIRLSRPNDINSITDMDLKCYPYPLEMSEWQEKIKGSGNKDYARIVVAEYGPMPLGFAMWSADLEHVGQLHRLGVLPQFRRKGLGTLLLAACNSHCRENQCDVLRTIVPSLHCQPGDPDDVSVFLTRTGFRATGKVLHSYRIMYGDEVDGYEFERRTDNAITLSD